MSSMLSSAAQDRKSRLAHLKSLKNKQSSTAEKQEHTSHEEPDKTLKRKQTDDGHDEANDDNDVTEHTTDAPDETSKYLSGRNYDATTKGPKLGFEKGPANEQETLEKRAATLAAAAKAEAKEKEIEDKPLDLASLQPKKPNWDLKRDLNRKLEILNPRTQNAISKLVRERVANAAQRTATVPPTSTTVSDSNGHASTTEAAGEQDDAPGLDGTTLFEATEQREREALQEEERDRQYAAQDLAEGMT